LLLKSVLRFFEVDICPLLQEWCAAVSFSSLTSVGAPKKS
jgi:hypothetical protein